MRPGGQSIARVQRVQRVRARARPAHRLHAAASPSGHFGAGALREAADLPEAAMLPKNILVPTDLSPHAEEAFEYACDLAAKLDATVHLVNVIGIPALGVAEIGVAVTSTMIESMVTGNQEALDALVARRRGDTRIGQVLMKTGDARDMIDEAAKEVGADLIVMGTHGRRGFSRALLGSVAETVVRTAPCPVLTVRSRHGKREDRQAA
jgi:universal stress protein A